MNLLHNLTDQLRNSDEQKAYEVSFFIESGLEKSKNLHNVYFFQVVSDYKNVLEFILNQKNEN